MTIKACTVCGTPCQGARCPAHGGDRRSMTTTQRGYDGVHRKRRKALLVRAYGTPCPLCGETMHPTQDLDLDHTTRLVDDPTSRGDRITHAECNRGVADRSSVQTRNGDPASRPRDIFRVPIA